jgi:hypothetical protein
MVSEPLAPDVGDVDERAAALALSGAVARAAAHDPSPALTLLRLCHLHISMLRRVMAATEAPQARSL